VSDENVAFEKGGGGGGRGIAHSSNCSPACVGCASCWRTRFYNTVHHMLSSKLKYILLIC